MHTIANVTYPLSLHDALPILAARRTHRHDGRGQHVTHSELVEIQGHLIDTASLSKVLNDITEYGGDYKVDQFDIGHGDRKSTRLNSSHVEISYAVFCLKKKNI